MEGFVVAVKKLAPIPPVTKAGLKEYILEYIVESDLVHVYISLSECIPTHRACFSLFGLLTIPHSAASSVTSTQSST